MEKPSALAIFAALASGLRLEAFRLLVKQGPPGMVAGEIAGALAVLPANLSFHLKVLSQARLVTVEQEGRFQRYRANIPLILELIAYLTEECCSGSPDQCLELRRAVQGSEALVPRLRRARNTAKNT